MKRLGVLFAVLLVLATASIGAAEIYQITLGWDPNSEVDLAGYRVYKSSASNAHDKDAGFIEEVGAMASPEVTVEVELAYSEKVYFVVTAFNSSDIESGYSNEVMFAADPAPGPIQNPPKAPGNARVKKVVKR